MEAHDHVDIPFLPYRLFFLYVEPVSAILGGLYAAQPATYLSLLTLAPTSTTPLPTIQSFKHLPASSAVDTTAVSMSLYQLANLYILFACNEHFVLSSTNSLRTWRRLLMGLLIADFGHLLSMVPLALDSASSASGGGWTGVYLDITGWNAMLWGSVGFVYVGAALRISFLCGLGLRRRVPGFGDTRDEKAAILAAKHE